MVFDTQGYHQFSLGDGSVIFRQGITELFLLNTSAHDLWGVFFEGRSIDHIAQKWTQHYGISHAQATGDIQTALASWRQQGLLGDVLIPPVALAVSQSPSVQITPAVCTHCRDYRLGHLNIRLQAETTELLAALHLALAPFACIVNDLPQAVFDIFQAEQRYWLCADGKVLWKGEAIDTVINGLFYELLQVGVREVNWLIALHAGAVSKGDTVIALSGIGGTGKSTLTAALVSRGFSYWGDDIIPIEKNSLQAIPLPIPMTLKEGSWNLLDSYYPSLQTLPIYQRAGRQVHYLPPPLTESLGKKSVSYLLFPRVSATESVQLRPLDPLESLQRLLAANSALPLLLDENTVSQLIDWVKTVPAFELVYYHLEVGMDIIERELL